MSSVSKLENEGIMNRVLIIGGGGHSLCIQDSLLGLGYLPERIGLIDIHKEVHALCGIRWVGSDEDLIVLKEAGWKKAAIGIGSIESTVLRRKLTKKVIDSGIELITIIDNSAIVSNSIIVGAGTFIAKRAVIQPGAVVGQMAIINTGAIIEHECKVGEYSHVSSGSVLLGGVQVGNDTLVGGGSIVRQGVHIGNNCIIGAGSVVVQDIPDNSIAYGNPCKVRRQNCD